MGEESYKSSLIECVRAESRASGPAQAFISLSVGWPNGVSERTFLDAEFLNHWGSDVILSRVDLL